MANPNNVILNKQRLIFMLPCKVAQTSIKDALMSAIGYTGEGEFTYLSLSDAQAHRNYRLIGIVRNPLDRLVSCCRDKVERGLHARFNALGFRLGMPFAEFRDHVATISDEEADQHFRSQHCDIGDRFDLLMRFEQLETHWQAVRAYIREVLDVPKLPHRRKSARQAWWRYYSPELLAKMRHRYRYDLALYGYA